MMKDAAKGGQADIEQRQIVVVQHWLDELKRLVPTK
jgi:hypothetical protein